MMLLNLVMLLVISPVALGSPILEPRVSATNIKCTDATAYGVSSRVCALLQKRMPPPPSFQAARPSWLSREKGPDLANMYILISNIDEHNKNVALLQICGGIAGSIQKCQGAPTSTTGASEDAKFTLNPTDAGATINISKGRWEQCIKSAEATCPNGQAYTATCPGGASTGDINFELAKQ